MSSTKTEHMLGGRAFSMETGLLAPQADGSIVAQYGGTVVLATAVMSEQIREGINYFPLLVDFEERMYASGKIKGSRFVKREGRPTDEAIISGRLVDRCLRPLFPEGMRNDVQVVVTTLSHDQQNDSDVIGINAASAALSISRIPFGPPIAACRVGHLDGAFVMNPTYEQRQAALMSHDDQTIFNSLTND